MFTTLKVLSDLLVFYQPCLNVVGTVIVFVSCVVFLVWRSFSLKNRRNSTLLIGLLYV